MNKHRAPDNRNTCLPTFDVAALFETLSTSIVSQESVVPRGTRLRPPPRVAVLWHAGSVLFNKCYMNLTSDIDSNQCAQTNL